MASIVLHDIPDDLLQEWNTYARQTGLPLDYFIREATTYSVRSDRLGVLNAQLVREQKLHQLKNKSRSKSVGVLPPVLSSTTTTMLQKLDKEPSLSLESIAVPEGATFDDGVSVVDLDEAIPRNI